LLFTDGLAEVVSVACGDAEADGEAREIVADELDKAVGETTGGGTCDAVAAGEVPVVGLEAAGDAQAIVKTVTRQDTTPFQTTRFIGISVLPLTARYTDLVRNTSHRSHKRASL